MESDAYPNHWRYIGLDQKRGYQVNMLLGMLIVNGPILLAILIFLMWPKAVADKATVQFDIVSVSDTTEVGASEEQSMGKPAGSSGQGSIAMLFPENFPSGYISGYMPNIKITRERSLPTLVSASPTFDAHELNPEIAIAGLGSLSDFNEGDGFGYGTGNEYGDGDDYGLPPQLPFMPRVPLILPKLSWNIGGHQEKGLIMFADIYWPTVAKETDTGYVEIIIDIDKKGRIEWEVIDEQPTGKGFANALIEALKRSKFNPPSDENGEKISVRVMLASTICFGCPAYIESTSGTMEATQLHQNQ